MKYAEFLTAVQDADEEKINEFYPKVFGVLVHFVQVRMGAELHDAEDAAQTSIMNVMDSIKDGKVTEGKKVIPYLMTSAKNHYLRILQKEDKFEYQDTLDASPEDRNSAFDSLVNKEQQEVLKQCLQSLKEDFRTFISHWFQFPGIDAETVASHFDMSVQNVWVKKHRVIKLLRECVFTKI